MPKRSPLPTSPHPQYISPLRVVDSGRGVCILFDIHAPYHNAPFLDQVLDLCASWGVDQLVLGGDWSDQHSLSAWGAEWQVSSKQAGEAILDAMRSTDLTDAERGKFLNLMTQAGYIVADDGISGELAITRQVLRAIGSQFRDIYAVIGNHDDRLLRKVDKSLTPRDMLLFILGGDAKNWHIEPFYFCEVYSGGEKFLIEHPKGAAATEAAGLAAKYQCHVIVGHSHLWQVGRDVSGKYWAIAAGHCSDELRMAYAATRHSRRMAHVPGAVIIRDGFPWVMNEWTPWDQLRRCK